MKKTFKLFGTGLLLIAFSAANAHYIVEDGEYIVSDKNFALFLGAPGTIGLDGNNEVLEGGTLDGYFGSRLWVWGPIKMRFDLIGFETETSVQFWIDENDGFHNRSDTEQYAPDNSLGTLSSPIDPLGDGAGWTIGAYGDYLPFGFNVTTNEGNSVATNENNFDSASRPNIFMSMVDDPTSRFGRSVFLAFDENLDGDYDDMFIRLTDVSIPAVPEPAALWLFGAGLVGLGILRKRIAK
ncbi:MAG TPA: PEP-CTERM sorting domain-containing protein [Gammaproteobacteria bacterium]